MPESFVQSELASILGNVGDGITAQGPDGRLFYANDAAARICGLASAAEMLELTGAELLERFELLGPTGEPIAADELPNRRALLSHRPEEGVVGYCILPTREVRWSHVRSTPLLDEQGALRLVVNVIHDITEERRVEERIATLAEAGAVLSSSLDVEATLGELARLLVPRLADYVLVDTVNEEGELRQVVISHRDPAREEILRDLRRRYPPQENEAHPVSRVLATREPYLAEDARAGELSRAAVDAEHLALYEALDATSYIVVPLEARGRVLGAISLGTGESRRRFGRLELELAHEIARRAALAMDNALLYRSAQQSYAQLDTLLVSAPVGIGFWDRDLRFVRVNDALAEINDLPAVEHPGLTLRDVKPELADRLEPLYRRVLETGEPIAHTESTDEDAVEPGDRRHWLSSYYPVRQDGAVVGVGAVIMDVTAQRRADERLRLLAEAGELFASSLDREEILKRISRVVVPRVADACNIYLADGDSIHRVAYANADPELEALMARLPDDYEIGPDAPGVFREILVSGTPLLASELGQDVVRALTDIGVDPETFARVGSRSMMFVPFVARGETLGVLTLGSRVPGRFGDSDLELALELARRASAALDQARLVGELRRRAQAAQALEFVGEGVFLVRRDGTIRLWNPAAAGITGLPEERVLGRRADEALAGWPLERALDRPETFPVERADGEVWLSLTAAPFPDGTVYAFRDLTQERAVEQLKTDFVSTVSHELRTPLAAIYGAAMTLGRDDVVLEEGQRASMLDVIASESERLARIVNDILLASRLDSGAAAVTIGRADASEIARGVVASAGAHLPEDVELVLDAPETGAEVAADPDGLRQVLVNLVENAVKYSPNGGRVELALSRRDGRVRFAVKDRGLGIPQAHQERIFEKFFRLDPNLSRGVGGSGLGLYISREIVRRMGGRIEVDSEPGRGSTFWFELPLA